jgi:hypothetical protein
MSKEMIPLGLTKEIPLNMLSLSRPDFTGHALLAAGSAKSQPAHERSLPLPHRFRSSAARVRFTDMGGVEPPKKSGELDDSASIGLHKRQFTDRFPSRRRAVQISHTRGPGIVRSLRALCTGTAKASEHDLRTFYALRTGCPRCTNGSQRPALDHPFGDKSRGEF